MLKIEGGEDFAPDFGCKLTDFVCKAQESAARTLTELLSWFSDVLLAQNNFEAGGPLWNTALNESSMWLGLAIMVTICTSIIGISVSILMMRPDLLKRSILGSLLALPATLLGYVLVYRALKIVDEFTAGLLEGLVKDKDGFMGFWETMMGKDLAAISTAAVAGSGPLILILAVLVLGMVFMYIALAFRDFALMLLIAFAPLAFILLPLPNGTVWLKRWGSAVVAMILTKPILIGTYTLIIAGFSNLDTVWSSESVTLGIGLIIASFLPLMLFSFFNFMGGADSGDAVGAAVASPAKRAGTALVGKVGGLASAGVAALGAAGSTGAPGSNSNKPPSPAAPGSQAQPSAPPNQPPPAAPPNQPPPAAPGNQPPPAAPPSVPPNQPPPAPNSKGIDAEFKPPNSSPKSDSDDAERKDA